MTIIDFLYSFVYNPSVKTVILKRRVWDTLEMESIKDFQKWSADHREVGHYSHHSAIIGALAGIQFNFTGPYRVVTFKKALD